MLKRIVIDDNESDFFIDNLGIVYRKDGSKVKAYEDRYGYLRVNIKIAGISKSYFRIHRLVAIMFIPNPNNFPQVNHINGNKKDNRVENLEWCNNSDNMKHAYQHGLHPIIRGQDHGGSKYTENQIIRVCELLELGKYKYKQISEMTNVSKSTIKDIVTGKSWKHISSNYDLTKSLRRKYKRYYKKIDDMILHGYTKKEIVCFLYDKNIGTKDNLSYIVQRRIVKSREKLKVLFL